ncbi:MAG: DsrE/DsrF/DrsH-like family protein [bacterium]
MEENKKSTIVVFSGDLDKVYASFIIATTAASMGKEVSMFFTFWGLNVLRKKRFLFKAPHFLQKMFGVLNRGGAERLPLSKFHLFGLGTFFMKFLMKKYQMDEITKMLALSKELGIKIIACTTSIQVMGLRKEDFIPEVDELAGASTYLNDAFKGNLNLFI